jgi:hypothetical protein
MDRSKSVAWRWCREGGGEESGGRVTTEARAWRTIPLYVDLDDPNVAVELVSPRTYIDEDPDPGLYIDMGAPQPDWPLPAPPDGGGGDEEGGDGDGDGDEDRGPRGWRWSMREQRWVARETDDPSPVST